jgi:sigma54-dependent transcription regulator
VRPGFRRTVKSALGNILGRNYRSVDCFSKTRLTALIELAKDNRSLIASGRAIIELDLRTHYPLTRIFDPYLLCRGATLIGEAKKTKS